VCCRQALVTQGNHHLKPLQVIITYLVDIFAKWGRKWQDLVGAKLTAQYLGQQLGAFDHLAIVKKEFHINQTKQT